MKSLSNDAQLLANPAPKWIRNFLLVLLVLASVLALSALVMTFSWAGGVGRLMQDGWGPYAGVIMRNKIAALWHGAFMTLCATLFIWLFWYGKIKARAMALVIPWCLVLLVAADALYLSRHYVKTMTMADLAENDVIRLLKADMPERRVALVSQSGFYNLWLTYLFPYHQIKTLNITQMPRMPIDYKKFLESVGRNPLRMWQSAAVGYVLAPAQVWTQIQQDPGMRDSFELVYAYNVQQQDMGVIVIPATASNPGQHVVLRLKAAAPRYALVAGWECLADQEALKRLASGSQRLFEKVLVAPESAAGLPTLAGQGMVGSVRRQSSTPERTVLEVSTEQPAILRIADKYDPDWKVWIDGRRVPMLRVDFIFQGVYIESGRHEVVLHFAPPTWPLWCQAIGILLCLGAAAPIIFARIHFRSRKTL